MSSRPQSISQRILGAVDLAIDFTTLGEYGLAERPARARHTADEPCRERPDLLEIGWEAFPTARPRGSCPAPRHVERPRRHPGAPSPAGRARPATWAGARALAA